MARIDKRDRRDNINISEQLKTVDARVKGGTFVFGGPMTVADFMAKINKPVAELIKSYFMKGKILKPTTMLTEEQIGEICFEYNLDFQIENEINKGNVLERMTFDDAQESLKRRPPIVTIMGHVDHGKTTLLDAIRKSNVAAGEAGGITQHIGAYQIDHGGSKITFIDTPGHEAFSKMRARGANVTDIIVIVVAADDGLMPQTEEAIDHAKQAKVPIIVFVNKTDKPNAQIDKVMGEMAAKDIVPEEWQGGTPFIKGSALKKVGINELLDTIVLLAEVNNYRANYDRLANGTVLEAHLDKGRGPVATIIVQGGTLKKGDFIAAGITHGRIRTIFSDLGKPLDEAPPGLPVSISGLLDVPAAGDRFLALKDEKEAKEIASIYMERANVEQRSAAALSEELKQKIESGEIKRMDLIVRADTHGSLEAIKGTLAKIAVSGTTLQVIRAAVGPVSETDVMLAEASHALICAFNVKTPSNVLKEAERDGVLIKHYDVIYRLKEDLEGLLALKQEKQYDRSVIGTAEVLKIWTHSDVGSINGCRVKSGKMVRNAKAAVVREGQTIHEGTIASMKHLKDDVKEVTEGKECGIVLAGFAQTQIGDTIEAYEMVERK